MYKRYGKDVVFFMVYIREAHPVNGWQVENNRRDGVLVKQPESLAERTKVAAQMCQKLNITLPALIDNMDDRVNKSYSGWPDRLYLVGRDGRIAYKGGPGPRGFKPGELQQAIQRELTAVVSSPRHE